MQAGVPGKKKKEEPKLSKIEERLNKMETFFDTQRYVVIDNGTGFLKAGFSGQDLPRVYLLYIYIYIYLYNIHIYIGSDAYSVRNTRESFRAAGGI